ncbi:hypothetical protein [Nocardioides sp. GXQ0305]|uniref:hypothetical protein n=1 Tax=Nocardioides sp. GXQ0305 TaxID=3423912 RepID=UPI003D7C3C08
MTEAASSPHPTLIRLLGWTAVVSSVLYLVSDVIEVAQGGFSSGQLWLTLVAEAAVPVVVVGLAVVQWPPLGPLGLAGALVYAYAFAYFTGTVVYALVRDTADFDQLGDALGLWMTVHGALMLLGGLAFGYRVARAGVLPPWTGWAFVLGVAAVTFGLPGWAGVVAAGVRDLALAGMGAALLTGAARGQRVGSR